ncbi:hypothetical protein Ahy_B04g072183 [Arachis hypogaea]|uniref:SWIM-type domain-containing protein n=1 Tax=Arachis hypogaea TaxID=3818 RepID=A0A444ZMQ8_ARAHY|nr:hypothetical protein Ahy_B04g072183 [Arachis hypogaea]
MSINEDDVKNDSDNDLGDDFDYQPNAEDAAEDDDVDSLDSTSKSEEVCGVKRIADLMNDMVRDNQGTIISRQLVCNKEGWRNMRYLDLDDRSREARSLTRTKCPAQLRVKLDYGCGRWKEIRNEIQRAGVLNIKVLSTTLDKVEFSVIALEDPAKDRRMEVDRGKNLFSCSCKLFESRGIPCSHVFCAMKFENILEFPDSLIYKRWTKNAKNEFISTEIPVNDDVERVLKFRVVTQTRQLNAYVNMEGINDPFVVKSKGAPSKRSSWRKKRACSNCHKYSHYYKRCPELMQHSVEGNPRDRSDGNASARDSGFSPKRFANSSRSFSVKSEHHSGPKTKPFKNGGTRKFTVTGMRNQKGKDNTFDEVIFVNVNL